MKAKIKNIIDDFISLLIKPNFNVGTFLNLIEQKLFQDCGFIRNKQYKKEEIKNILISRLDVIGDYVLTTPFIREIRNNYPQANIVLVVSPLVYNLAKSNKYVDEVYIFDGNVFNRLIESTFIELFQFCFENLWFKDNKFRQFDYAFTPQCGSYNDIAILLSYLSGAVERVGYGPDPYVVYQTNLIEIPEEDKFEYLPNHYMDSFLLTNSIVLSKKEDHEVEKYMLILKLMELSISSTDLEINILDDVINKMKNKLSMDKKRIVIGIGASQEKAIYDISKLNQALQLIYNENIEFIFLGGINDSKKMKQVTVPHVNFVGKLNLQETAAVISLSNLYIGNDTGLMHVAAAFKIPVIEISREAKEKTYSLPHIYSSIYRFHPWNTKYIILQPDFALDECKSSLMYGGCISSKAHCINQIKPEEIVEAYEKIEI